MVPPENIEKSILWGGLQVEVEGSRGTFSKKKKNQQELDCNQSVAGQKRLTNCLPNIQSFHWLIASAENTWEWYFLKESLHSCETRCIKCILELESVSLSVALLCLPWVANRAIIDVDSKMCNSKCLLWKWPVKSEPWRWACSQLILS